MEFFNTILLSVRKYWRIRKNLDNIVIRMEMAVAEVAVVEG